MAERTTPTGDIIAAVNGKERYDEACKRVLALKEIAARILQATVEEFKGFSVDEIIACINETEVGKTPVDVDAPFISTDNSEDTTLTEGRRFFDVRFTVSVPKNNEQIYLIVNIEGQNKFSLEYPILKRMVYYLARMVSSQYGTVFTNSEYGRIRKVYSIWICFDPAEEYRNTITKYSLTRESIEGEVRFKDEAAREKEHSEFNLMTGILIGLTKPDDKELSENGIIRMLSVLFAKNMEYADKRIILQGDYGVKITEEFDEEVESMCNLSEGVYESGFENGKSLGTMETLAGVFNSMLSRGMTFEDAAYLTSTPPDMAEKVRLYLESNKGDKDKK